MCDQRIEARAVSRRFPAAGPGPETVSGGKATSPPAARQQAAASIAAGSALSTRVAGSAVISVSSLHLRRSRGYKAADSRSVAQSGSAPRSGRGGRRFKSCHSDHKIKHLAHHLNPKWHRNGTETVPFCPVGTVRKAVRLWHHRISANFFLYLR